MSGQLGGRKLQAPDGRDTRPTTERVREAVFNALYSLDLIEGSTMVDLFAGSGALGLEALSRGAAHVTFVERSRDAAAVVRANLDALGIIDRADVRETDALAWLRQSTSIDVALADPPYGFDQWEDLLAACAGANVGCVVAESAAEVAATGGYEVTRARRYGSTVVTFLTLEAQGSA